eukprot:scaffold64346_cov87-Phaeocystis_antarctica.AAC.1
MTARPACRRCAPRRTLGARRRSPGRRRVAVTGDDGTHAKYTCTPPPTISIERLERASIFRYGVVT